RYGSKRFKAIIHKALEDIMSAGALGAEIIISGKVPSDRAKSWRISAGYLRKCGDIAITKIKKAKTQAELKTGVIGIKVNITPPDPTLLDKIELKELEVKEEKKDLKEKAEEKKITREEVAEKETKEKEQVKEEKSEKVGKKIKKTKNKESSKTKKK
ncbi:MAG: hypothetical protein QXU20_02790, partial [Candidatus Woesearchaeota archaeon]